MSRFVYFQLQFAHAFASFIVYHHRQLHQHLQFVVCIKFQLSFNNYLNERPWGMEESICGLWDQMAIDEFHLVFGTFLVACDSLKRLPKLLSQSKLICT